MKKWKTAIPWLLLLSLLSGCGQDQEPEQPVATATAATETVEVATEIIEPTATTVTLPTPTVELLPTITPEPTPITPAISIDSQTLAEDGTITIESVTSADAGWLVIFADNEGAPGSVLGYEAVGLGEGAVSVTIDPYAATPTLYAGLHIDAGNSGEFEYPGSDIPVEAGSQALVAPFTVDIDLPLPLIVVADQVIGSDGLVHVDEAFTLAPNWLVIHTYENGDIGPAIGQLPLDTGSSKDLAFPIRWQDATAELVAMLHEDNERPGGFNPASDIPILSAGSPVTAQFSVQLPPDIFAYDQPVVDGKVMLDRVISDKPGWLVIFNVLDGQPDRIIGSAQLSKGINLFVEVEVAETAVTPELSLALHEETDNPAEFNYPLSDPPATYEDEIIPPTILYTNPGNYLITRDQTLGEENEVVIPLIVSDLDTWLVIYTQTEDGQIDEIIGQAWLPAGINRDSRIAIPSGLVGENLIAMLHQDSGNPREFDYPEGDDVPLLRNREFVLSPFTLLESSTTENVNPR